MAFKRITAIVNNDRLEAVENGLKELGVPGISVSTIKGFGTHKNFFYRDWMEPFAKLQIYVPDDRVDAITQAIMKAAHTGEDDDGIIAVTPVERMYRIQDGSELHNEDMSH